MYTYTHHRALRCTSPFIYVPNGWTELRSGLIIAHARRPVENNAPRKTSSNTRADLLRTNPGRYKTQIARYRFRDALYSSNDISSP